MSVSPALLHGKVAIVTGATQGLGADIAQCLHAHGAHVIVVGRHAQHGQAVCRHIHPHGERVRFQATDIGDDAQIDACIQTALDSFGGLDILVNNACRYDDQGLASTREQWHRTLDTNLVSAAIFAQKAMPVMRSGGVVVNMGSTGGKFGAAGRALYPASKAALLQLTRNLAVDAAPLGLRVVSVSPAWTWSPAVSRLSQGNRVHADQVAGQLHPLGRVGDGAEIGQVVAFACSAMAAWITGVDIPADGGFSMLGPDQGRSPASWFQQAGVVPDTPA